MAVAFDAFTAIAPGPNPSGTHTPVGTPRGILALVVHLAAEPITAATYGGVSCGAAVAEFVVSVGGEVAGAQLSAFVLGASVPTGAQTVAFSTGASGAVPWVYSVTATGNVEFIASAEIESTSQADPSTTLPLGGRTCFVAEAFGSGQGAVGGTTPLANWTSRNEIDIGAAVEGSYSYDVIGSADVTVGLTQTADDVALLAVAISEIVAVGGNRRRRVITGAAA